MKKGFFVILAIAVILSIISFLPVSQKNSIEISATFDNTLSQIINIDNWKNWYPEMKAAYKKDPSHFSLQEDTSKKNYTIIIPHKKYIIHVITPMSYQVNEVNGNWVNIFAFTLFPGNTLGKMKIIILKKSPFLFSLFGKNKEGEEAVSGLRSFLEDTKAFYGFGIEMSKIRDSAIAIRSFNTTKKDIFSEIRHTFQSIMNYIKDRNLIKTGPLSISYSSLTDDSLRITVGIPVNKPAPSLKDINCRLMPAKGNVLVGYFDGKFSARMELYTAMSKYFTEHTLSAPALPFERYLNDSIPTSDSSRVRIELNYPVY